MGLQYEDNEIDQETANLLTAYADWDQFGILPWEAGSKADDVYTYWKAALRHLDMLRNQARQNLNSNKIDSDLENERSTRRRTQRHR